MLISLSYYLVSIQTALGSGDWTQGLAHTRLVFLLLSFISSCWVHHFVWAVLHISCRGQKLTENVFFSCSLTYSLEISHWISRSDLAVLPSQQPLGFPWLSCPLSMLGLWAHTIDAQLLTQVLGIWIEVLKWLCRLRNLPNFKGIFLLRVTDFYKNTIGWASFIWRF